MAAPAAAQDEVGERSRYRATLGPQVYPSYPGSDAFDVGPFVNVDRARGDEPFDFEAPDEGFGFTLVETGSFAIGPVVNWEGPRTAEDVGAELPKVKFSLEPGVFASLDLGESVRLRGELRKGVTGHKGWIGVVGADWVMRDGDQWLFSLGPRLTWSDNGYHDAWFGVSPAAAATSGLPAYDPGSGIQAAGAAASFLTQLGPNWGIYAYAKFRRHRAAVRAAKYDRLVGDAADSPIVRTFGSRDQLSGGLALTYTWGSGR